MQHHKNSGKLSVSRSAAKTCKRTRSEPRNMSSLWDSRQSSLKIRYCQWMPRHDTRPVQGWGAHVRKSRPSTRLGQAAQLASGYETQKSPSSWTTSCITTEETVTSPLILNLLKHAWYLMSVWSFAGNTNTKCIWETIKRSVTLWFSRNLVSYTPRQLMKSLVTYLIKVNTGTDLIWSVICRVKVCPESHTSVLNINILSGLWESMRKRSGLFTCTQNGPKMRCHTLNKRYIGNVTEVK